jgi:hypothetical protein
LIARKSGWMTLALVILVGVATLSEAASFSYGFSTFDTGSGSRPSWNIDWGWYKPKPSPKPVDPKPVPDPVKPPVQNGDLTSAENLAVAKVNAERKELESLREWAKVETMVETSVECAKELAPVVEELAPVVEELAPVVEELTPVVEELTPVVEEPAPQPAKPKPEREVLVWRPFPRI